MSTQITSQQLEFLPRIYDAVTSPEKWSEILDEFAFNCGADGTSIMLGDNTFPEISMVTTSNFKGMELLSEYMNLHGKADAKALTVVAQKPVFTWITEEEAFGVPANQIPGNLWQREHFGFDKRVAARLCNTPLWIDSLILLFKIGNNNLSSEGDAISQIFLPHLAKTVEVSRPFLLLKERFNAILSVLDYLQIGIAITNRAGEIVATNKEAKEIFESKNGISLSLDQKILLGDTSRQSLLSAQIEAAVDTSSPKNFEALITCRKREGTLPWLLDVFPLGNLDGSIDPLFKGAAVFITDPERKDIISTKGIRALFQLTDAESEVCALLTAGHRIEDIADSRNSTPTTVRGQIKNLFLKTDTNSQTDLVRLALKVNLPVARK